MVKMKVQQTFIDNILGSSPSDPEVYQTYIASKSPDKQKELEAIREAVNNIKEDDGTDEGQDAPKYTIFPQHDGKRVIFPYQIKGMLKNAASACYRIGGKNKLTAFKGKIDKLVFIKEDYIYYQLPEGTEVTILERPLRASTAQGERVALSASECLPKGTKIEFTMFILDDTLYKDGKGKQEVSHIMNWLKYGVVNGLGQWHNSGKGRYIYKVLDVKTGLDPFDYLEDLQEYYASQL